MALSGANWSLKENASTAGYFSREFFTEKCIENFKKKVLGLLAHVTASNVFSRILKSEALVYNSYFFQNSRFTEIIRHWILIQTL